ncbi:MAG: antibiotic biosynthesis monooxygenase [Ideonella sp.]|jgi:quinol monooxygenase YgiN|nr:antibiotic biosynthesis monooxygenase [Ideonella sp.]
MIIVTGSVVAKSDCFDELLAFSLDHVRRSRTEPGCLSHAVSRDAENPLRLVFFEQWADLAALQAHFAVPASRGFVKVLAAFAEVAPEMQIYEAAPVGPPG